MKTLQQELRVVANDLTGAANGAEEAPAIAESIKRLSDLADALERQGMVLVLPKTIQGRKSGTPYVTGDMVYLERQGGGGAA